MTKTHITSDDFKADTVKLIKKLKKLGLKKKKTAVVAVARGGLIPAQYIAYALGIRDIFAVTSKLYEGTKKNGKSQELGNLFLLDYETFDNFIIVDDIYDSGETMQGILYGLGEVAAAFKEDCNFIPAVVYTQHSKSDMKDEGIIYGSKIKKKDGQSPWLVFPWDDLEDGQT